MFLLPEEMWKDIVVEDRVKVLSHDCFINRNDATDGGFNCKKLKDVGICFSRKTGLSKTTKVQGWQCYKCNFTLCI
jgi:hypothetical protein